MLYLNIMEYHYTQALGRAQLKEVIIALVSSSITIVITSFFNYHFQLMKEVRNESVKYKTEILIKVYTPVLKILVAAVVPGEGYEGITKEALFEISRRL